MSFSEVLEEYFLAEERLGRVLVPFCVTAGVASTAATWAAQTPFAYGAGVPMALFGIAGAVAASRFLARTRRQRRELPVLYLEDPQGFSSAETPRMRKLNLAWPRLMRIYAVVGGVSVVGLVLAPVSWAQGLACTLLFLSALFYVVDIFAEKRALAYTGALENLGSRRMGGSVPNTSGKPKTLQSRQEQPG